MIKTVFIPAHFKPILRQTVNKVPTGEKKQNWLGFEKNVYKTEVNERIMGYSDCEIDGTRLSDDINAEISKWEARLVRIISITTVNSGRYNFNYSDAQIQSSQRILGNTEKVRGGGSYGYGYGYSYTEGVLICLEITN